MALRCCRSLIRGVAPSGVPDEQSDAHENCENYRRRECCSTSAGSSGLLHFSHQILPLINLSECNHFHSGSFLM